MSSLHTPSLVPGASTAEIGRNSIPRREGMREKGREEGEQKGTIKTHREGEGGRERSRECARI